MSYHEMFMLFVANYCAVFSSELSASRRVEVIEGSHKLNEEAGRALAAMVEPWRAAFEFVSWKLGYKQCPSWI